MSHFTVIENVLEFFDVAGPCPQQDSVLTHASSKQGSVNREILKHKPIQPSCVTQGNRGTIPSQPADGEMIICISNIQGCKWFQ